MFIFQKPDLVAEHLCQKDFFFANHLQNCYWTSLALKRHRTLKKIILCFSFNSPYKIVSPTFAISEIEITGKELLTSVMNFATKYLAGGKSEV